MSVIKSHVNIRLAHIADLTHIVEIHNNIILEGGLTADMAPYQLEEKNKWFEEMTQKPFVIQVLEVDKVVAGYVYLSPWRNGRAALRHVAEISYYLAKSFRGSGYGRKLLQTGMDSAVKGGFKTLLAILLDSNVTSVSLLESEGFHVAGHLPDVAELKDKVAGQFIMMKEIN